MRFASFSIGGRSSWGIVEGAEVLDLGGLLGDRLPDLKSAIAADALGDLAEPASHATRHPFAAIAWLPVIPNPDKILCVGLNYEDHRKETGRAEVEHPTIFARYANTQIAQGDPIIRPRVSTSLDYEGELAVIIGKQGRYIPRDAAMVMSPVIPATMMAVCVISSGIPTSSPRARTSPAPAPLVPGW